ncbi:hypothetical protein HPP92_024213 [Vanilla planifolia]|uniref:Uncharacterized protein n=1 Tax=Vanilla planifolia TaxID=51239 RepID=A0A835PLZ2_VANPL|nr:hypothetical protein HPP92_024213 [Vanilla planifolia]
MNPLCCIAPVSVERGDRGSAPVVSVRASAKPALGLEKPCEELVEQAACSGASVGGCGECGGRTEPGGRGRGGTVGRERGKSSGGGNVKVAGILYKWVNYGKDGDLGGLCYKMGFCRTIRFTGRIRSRWGRLGMQAVFG